MIDHRPVAKFRTILSSQWLIVVGSVIVAVAYLAVSPDLFSSRPPPPPDPRQERQQEMADECRINGGELNKGLTNWEEQGLILNVGEAVDHTATIQVDENAWQDATDAQQGTVEIAGFCHIATPEGRGTVIIRGSPGGAELARFVNGSFVEGAADKRSP